MSDEMLIDVLHKTFICGKCGSCCRHGGQIRITPSEAQEIADYLDIDMSSMELFPFTAHIDDPDYLYLEVCDPCFFWDKVELTCMIHEVKPQFCKDYPWKLFKENGCLLSDIIICPSVCVDLAAVLARPVEDWTVFKFSHHVDYNERWQLRLHCYSIEIFGYIIRLEINKL